MKIIKKYISLKYLFFFCAVLILPVFQCADVAPTVEQFPATVESPVQEQGSLLPRIQLVYPGTLQTLDIPQSYPTDVYPEGASIAIVFSHVMENDSNEMSMNMLLFKDYVSIPSDIYPSNLSSKTFTIAPIGEDFQPDTVYTLRIYRFASVVNEPGRTLDFESLVEPPATTIDPINSTYADYTFRTGQSGYIDDEPPVVLSTNPADGATGVPQTTSYIEIVFSDNMRPMINPHTANTSSVILYNITESLPVAILVDMVDTDIDFKTYRITPQVSFGPSIQYRLTISPAGAKVEDFKANTVDVTYIYFTTAP